MKERRKEPETGMKCKWEIVRDCFWLYSTGCNNKMDFQHGNIKDNNFKYCPFCGKEIEGR